jgi:G3E family GTPase
MENTSQVPVTVLTGFLGAGKTTLLNRILTEQHGRKYAVIVNEFGEQGIDNDLVVDADEEVFEMNNGCICCTVRGDLIRILSGLMKRADQLDAIIVETTGLADPAPVAQTFFVDEDVADRTKLDAIVTVADAVHLSSQLTDHHEAEEQIAFADVVLLNKIELVDEGALKKVNNRIRKINPFAKIIKTTRCDAPLDEIIGLNAFSLDRVLKIEPDFLESDHDHDHDDDVTSLSFVADNPLDMEKFHAWFGNLLRTKGQDILRSKGILDFAGEEERYVFQGVHMLMDASPMGSWPKGKARSSRIVFIGRNLDTMGLKEGFDNCKAG